MPHPEIQQLLRLIDEAYEKKAWHGPNLRSSVRGLTGKEAAWRPGLGRHNIWEIVIHAAYWKYAVRRRLRGDQRGSFSYKGSNWFPCPASPTEKAWRADVALLEQEHRQLRQTIAAFPRAGLRKRFRSARTTPLDNIIGIAFHDVYHAGQIRLLRKFEESRKRT